MEIIRRTAKSLRMADVSAEIRTTDLTSSNAEKTPSPFSSLKDSGFWDVTPYRRVSGPWPWRCTAIHRNVGNYPPIDTTWHHIAPESSLAQLWESQISQACSCFCANSQYRCIGYCDQNTASGKPDVSVLGRKAWSHGTVGVPSSKLTAFGLRSLRAVTWARKISWPKISIKYHDPGGTVDP